MALKANVADDIVLQLEKDREAIAAKWIVAFGLAIGVWESAEIARVLVEIENLLLVKLFQHIQVVAHGERERGTRALRFVFEAFCQHEVEVGAHRFQRDALHHVAGEGADHDLPGLLQSDPAGTQIKNRLLVHLTDGGAMGAFDIVGKDFQLGLGVNDGVVGEEEVAVVLFGVGFLGFLADKDFAVEHAVGAAGQNAVVEFVAFATGLGVVHHGVVIGQLLAPDQVKAVENAVAIFALENRFNLMAGQVRAGGDGVRSPMAALALLRLNGGDVNGVLVLLLNLAVVQPGLRADHQLGHGVGEMGSVGKAEVSFQSLHLAARPGHNQVADMGGGPGLAGGGDEEQMDRLGNDFSGGG